MAQITSHKSLVNLGDQKVHKMVKFCVHQCTQTARRYEAPSLRTSYFPAQKSELHFLIEPSNIRESAPGCRHRRIDELWNGGCSAIQGRIAGVYSGRWSSLVAGG